MEKRSPGIVWYYCSLATYVVPVNEGVEESTMVCPKFMVKIFNYNNNDNDNNCYYYYYLG